MNFKLVTKYLAIFPLILFISCNKNSDYTDSEKEQIIHSNAVNQMLILYPDFPTYEYVTNDGGPYFIQTIQFIDSLGVKKVHMGILAACLNLKVDTRDRVYGGELYINGVNVPFNNQNYYAKWYEDTLGVENLLSDTIHLELKGNEKTVQINDTIFHSFPRPYVIKDLPSVIIKEDKYDFDSTIYFSGDKINSYSSIYHVSYILQSNERYSAQYNPNSNSSFILKAGICFIKGFISNYNDKLTFIRIIEYKKSIPVQ